MGELNVSELSRKLGINYETTKKHLETLENEDILKHKNYGRIRLYKINEQSPKAKAIQRLIETWEQVEKNRERQNRKIGSNPSFKPNSIQDPGRKSE